MEAIIIKNERAAWKRENKNATAEEKENLDTWEERRQKILDRIPHMTEDDKFVESVMWAPGTTNVEALLPIYSADAAHMTRGKPGTMFSCYGIHRMTRQC
eukprot:gb/GECG01010029.1/.p1 GENE.gb/GECG01010029.1/~~gb/GECG01010029.1/.p1  ORF type:complete len:100 (+),score=12.63 gb/GECG01010029.1/:1-300(+)